MGIRLATFQQHQLTAQDYALLCAKSVSSGIFYGCNVTIKDESTLHVTSGVGIANGRTFDVTDDDYPVELTGGGSMVGRIYVHVDLADVDTPAQILVVKGATLPALVQDSDMNESTGVWDLELATFDVDASEISNLVYTASGVSGGGGGTMLAPYYDASEAWLKDQIFQKDGVLYKCLADIAVGAPLVVGTNVKVTDFAEETEALNQNLTKCLTYNETTDFYGAVNPNTHQWVDLLYAGFNRQDVVQYIADGDLYAYDQKASNTPSASLSFAYSNGVINFANGGYTSSIGAVSNRFRRYCTHPIYVNRNSVMHISLSTATSNHDSQFINICIATQPNSSGSQYTLASISGTTLANGAVKEYDINLYDALISQGITDFTQPYYMLFDDISNKYYTNSPVSGQITSWYVS